MCDRFEEGGNGGLNSNDSLESLRDSVFSELRQLLDQDILAGAFKQNSSGNDCLPFLEFFNEENGKCDSETDSKPKDLWDEAKERGFKPHTEGGSDFDMNLRENCKELIAMGYSAKDAVKMLTEHEGDLGGGGRSPEDWLNGWDPETYHPEAGSQGGTAAQWEEAKRNGFQAHHEHGSDADADLRENIIELIKMGYTKADAEQMIMLNQNEFGAQGRTLADIYGQSSSWFGSIVNGIGNVVETVGKPVVDAVDLVGDVAEELVNPVVDLAETVTDGLLDLGVWLADPVIDIAGEVAKPVIHIAEEVLEPIVHVATDLAKPIVKVAGKVLEPVIDAVEDVGEEILDFGQPLFDFAEGIGEGLIDVAETVGEPIIDAAGHIPVVRLAGRVREHAVHEVEQIAEVVAELGDECHFPGLEIIDDIVETTLRDFQEDDAA